MKAKIKIDKEFIKQVAADFNYYNLSDEDIQRAHEYALDGAEEDYYYKLKEFFLG